MSMIPKGGDTIWGGIDWSPEECNPSSKRKQQNNDIRTDDENERESIASHTKPVNYGRIVSFGKDAAELPSIEIERIDFRVTYFIPSLLLKRESFRFTIPIHVSYPVLY